MKTSKYILSGGGTGGHIYPAIAIANELKSLEPNATIVFVGAYGKMEMEKVPQAGYKIHGLWISGLQRKKLGINLLFPIKLFVSFFQALLLWLRYCPDVLIGTGGFASGPMLFVGKLMGSKTFLQEQNSFPGITNKLLARKANGIAVAYPKMEKYFSGLPIHLTGNPVRSSLLSITSNRQKAYTFFDLNPTKKTLVIIGGSLGAKRINALIAQHLPLFENHNLQLLWQCGQLYYNEMKTHASSHVKVHAFIREMADLYAVADIVISRAGAASISELCIVAKPSILIPSPNVAENHQYHNANALAERNAALLIEEKTLDSAFEDLFINLLEDESQQLQLSTNIKKLALPEATKTIVKHIQNLNKIR